ncbi:MFS transporter [Modestobacter sp. L9-4]|uniref:MFS transporter n=1 Tax=Modestobacter sp. L9-4 TaxID=2851567 RepID=UPI001C744A53|nr:MFS transporter [Modestobacter sp. L9-4]QXG74891.1 MFS transporter [Modestobacter sp. L9-4]
MTSTAADPAPRPGSFRALRAHNFRLYVSANLVSQTGTWMQRIGQDWLVLQLSGDSGVALGVTTALQFGPSLFFSFYGGVLADRYDKRRLLMVTQAVMGVLALALGLLVATDSVALWHVYLLALLVGVVSSLDTPVRQSFVSEMVGPDLLANAVSLNSTVFNAARLVGPAVAGGLIALAGGNTAPAFLVNAVSFATTIAALVLMRADELDPSPPAPRSRGQLRQTLAYTRQHPDLMLAMGLAFTLGTFGFNSQITIALMAREVFGLGAGAFGLLSTAYAVGSLSGALLSTRRSTRPLQRFLIVSAVAFGVLLVVSGLMRNYYAFAALLIPTGAAALVFSVACNSFVQLGVEPQWRGRVLALYFMAFLGGTPVGAPLIGWVSERLGAPWGLISGGLVCVVVSVLAGVVLARGRRVRLEMHVLPPRMQLHVAATTPPNQVAVLAEEADGGVPAEAVLGDQVARDPAR